MTKVEEVARAIHDALFQPGQPLCDCDYEAARAAITALMEPSTASLDAGVACALNITVAGEGGWTKYVTTLHRAMLKAALAEE